MRKVVGCKESGSCHYSPSQLGWTTSMEVWLLNPDDLRGISCWKSVLNTHLTSSSRSHTWHDESYAIKKEIGASPIRFQCDMKENVAPR